jgi:2-keto-4-pentenoate hydratase/2-oxohepta-3-ene-1,7-dioic acid hydratase in catechol pathway
MERLYRVSRGNDRFFAVEQDGVLRRAVPAGSSIFDGYEPGLAVDGGLAAVTVHTPVAPSKVVCVGLNYRDHAEEMKKVIPPEPLLFTKPPSSVLDPDAPILIPPGVGTIHYEAELAVVIGKRAHRVPASRAWDVVLGVTCLNDVTARDIQNRETQYTRAKGFDTFAPIGPCVAVGLDPAALDIEGWANGEKRQSSNTNQLIFSVARIIEHITAVMTLLPGDVIATGTPAGIGPLKPGDKFTVKIAGIGELSNPVVE